MILLMLALTFGAPGVAAGSPARLAEDFERGLCVAPCRAALWPHAQLVEGALGTVAFPGRGQVLRASVGPRVGDVPKAALVARPPKLGRGEAVRIAFDLMVPEGAPLDSVHLLDLECASCGVGGNPGIRLYLRRGRLRIDRSKIGVRHAWSADGAPQLEPGRWHRIEFAATVGDESGGARVLLDGQLVLAGEGATAIRAEGGAAPGADRIQIGITASSNARPAIAYFDRIRIDAGE